MNAGKQLKNKKKNKVVIYFKNMKHIALENN